MIRKEVGRKRQDTSAPTFCQEYKYTT